MARVFISSTGLDLQSYREAAIDVCNRLELIPLAMEFFEASGRTKRNSLCSTTDQLWRMRASWKGTA
jgi:hypothetical protein